MRLQPSEMRQKAIVYYFWTGISSECERAKHISSEMKMTLIVVGIIVWSFWCFDIRVCSSKITKLKICSRGSWRIISRIIKNLIKILNLKNSKNLKIFEEYEEYSRIHERYEDLKKKIRFFWNYGEYWKNIKIVREFWNFGEYLKIFPKIWRI
jgi:hypothetical protein